MVVMVVVAAFVHVQSISRSWWIPWRIMSRSLVMRESESHSSMDSKHGAFCFASLFLMRLNRMWLPSWFMIPRYPIEPLYSANNQAAVLLEVSVV